MSNTKTIFPPFYTLNSPLLKAAINCKDVRTIKKYLKDAGIVTDYFGTLEIVTHENLMQAIKKNKENHNPIDFDGLNFEISDSFRDYE